MTVPNQHVRGVLGKTIGLECEIESFPRAQISWVKRDPPYDPIETGGRYRSFTFHGDDLEAPSLSLSLVVNIYI